QHTRFSREWSSDVCSSDLLVVLALAACGEREFEPVVAVADESEPLPAPLPAAGPVTAVPDPRANGSGVLSDPARPADAAVPTLYIGCSSCSECAFIYQHDE